jgi:serine/threonine protein kinase
MNTATNIENVQKAGSTTNSTGIDTRTAEETMCEQTANQPNSFKPQADSRAQAAPEILGSFGRYEIIRKIGEGGMGFVYLAQDTLLDRAVALKVPDLARSDEYGIRWFRREARAMATVSHSSICPIYDIGVIDDRNFITMAYIDGTPLADVLQDGKPLSFGYSTDRNSMTKCRAGVRTQASSANVDSQDSATWRDNETRTSHRQIAMLIGKLAAGLAAAHEAGIVHRDLKPSNIMITSELEPIILDFGVAHRDNANETQLTKTGIALGTPYYMAPEQVEGNPQAIGPATDIYALGVIMYQTLCGKLPFEGTTTRVLTNIVTTDPSAPSAIQPDVDPALERICQKAMARYRRDRFTSADELASVLQEWLELDESTDAPRIEPDSTVSRPTPNTNHWQERQLLPKIRPYAIHVTIALLTITAAFLMGAATRSPLQVNSSVAQTSPVDSGGQNQNAIEITISNKSPDSSVVRIELDNGFKARR